MFTTTGNMHDGQKVGSSVFCVSKPSTIHDFHQRNLQVQVELQVQVSAVKREGEPGGSGGGTTLASIGSINRHREER